MKGKASAKGGGATKGARMRIGRQTPEACPWWPPPWNAIHGQIRVEKDGPVSARQVVLERCAAPLAIYRFRATRTHTPFVQPSLRVLVDGAPVVDLYGGQTCDVGLIAGQQVEVRIPEQVTRGYLVTGAYELLYMGDDKRPTAEPCVWWPPPFRFGQGRFWIQQPVGVVAKKQKIVSWLKRPSATYRICADFAQGQGEQPEFDILIDDAFAATLSGGQSYDVDLDQSQQVHVQIQRGKPEGYAATGTYELLKPELRASGRRVRAVHGNRPSEARRRSLGR